MTNAELVILSLIVEAPRHGYEIERIIEERNMREWTEIGFSSIYYLLRKLEKDGLIESRTEPSKGKGPGRKVYSPTAEGIKECHQATIRALEIPHRCYPQIQLGMANITMVSEMEAIDALRRYRVGLGTRLKKIKNSMRKGPYPENVEAMFDHSHTMVQAELRWIEKYIKNLENKMEKKDDDNQ